MARDTWTGSWDFSIATSVIIQRQGKLIGHVNAIINSVVISIMSHALSATTVAR